MVLLTPYTSVYESLLLRWIATFFGFHRSLVESQAEEDMQNQAELQETLCSWTQEPSALYVLEQDGRPVGFLRLAYRGPIAAWVEDLFVEESQRGKGIATQAVQAAEAIVKARPGCTALCMDVVPRNEAALRLYHRMGFTDLSLLTLRKELVPSKRDRDVELFGLPFRY